MKPLTPPALLLATLALSTNFSVSVGVAELEGGWVVSLREKPPLGKPVTIGILVLEGRVLPLVEGLMAGRGEADIMGDLIPALIERGERVRAYLTEAFWYDVGSTERYEKLDPEEVDRRLGFLFEEAVGVP